MSGEGVKEFFWLECPSCEWDCVVGPPGIGDLGLTCPLCAADNGRDVYLLTNHGEMPDKVEGHDARKATKDPQPQQGDRDE